VECGPKLLEDHSKDGEYSRDRAEDEEIPEHDSGDIDNQIFYA